MDFRFTEDQRLLADGAREFLRAEVTAERVRASWQSAKHCDSVNLMRPAGWQRSSGSVPKIRAAQPRSCGAVPSIWWAP